MMLTHEWKKFFWIPLHASICRNCTYVVDFVMLIFNEDVYIQSEWDPYKWHKWEIQTDWHKSKDLVYTFKMESKKCDQWRRKSAFLS